MRKSLDCSLPINPRYGNASLSWSDVVAIESNVDNWLKQIKFKNRALDYGTHVHTMIERGHYDVPRLGNPETKFQVEIPIAPRSKKTFTVVGKVDDHNDEMILDYKTGTQSWTQKKASEHQQFHVYGFLKWKATGVMPKYGKLVWLETCYDEDCDGLVLTGKMKEFNFNITLTDMLKIQTRFIRAYHKVVTALP